MKDTCKTCIYWKNKQRELNYSNDIGICLHPSNSFNDGRVVGILDTQNLKDRNKIWGNTSHDLECVESPITNKLKHSRYLLVTDERFGCNRYEVEDHLHKE